MGTIFDRLVSLILLAGIVAVLLGVACVVTSDDRTYADIAHDGYLAGLEGRPETDNPYWSMLGQDDKRNYWSQGWGMGDMERDLKEKGLWKRVKPLGEE